MDVRHAELVGGDQRRVLERLAHDHVRPPARDQREHSGQRGARELAREDLVDDDPVLLAGTGGADALPDRRERLVGADRRRRRTAAWRAQRAARTSAERRRARRAQRAGRLGRRESAGRCARRREWWRREGASPKETAPRRELFRRYANRPISHAMSVPPKAKKHSRMIHGHGPVADGPALSDREPRPDPVDDARVRCPSASGRDRCRRRRSPRRTGSPAHGSWGIGSGQASRTGSREHHDSANRTIV